jgi:hypothetical protein
LSNLSRTLSRYYWDWWNWFEAESFGGYMDLAGWLFVPHIKTAQYLGHDYLFYLQSAYVLRLMGYRTRGYK